MLAHRLASGVAVTAATLSMVLVSAIPAAADPPLTAAEAKAQIEVLETEAAAIDQQYVAVQEKIKQGQRQLKQKRADLATQKAKVERMRVLVGQVALAQFQNRTIDPTAQLFLTSDTDTFLNQISTVQKVSENQNTVLQDFQSEQAELDDLERSAATDLASLEGQKKSLTTLREQSEAKITESKTLLARLTAEEQKRIADEEARAEAAARAQAEGTTGSGAETTTGTETTTTAGSSRGAKALAFAKSQIGKPYRYAAAGPDAYDCSGLTSAAWRAAGISLPRTSSAQYRVGKPVAKGDLQPGDLVFFYSDISHVGLYAGNGQLIHSPRPGKTVQYTSMSYMPYVGARRPG